MSKKDKKQQTPQDKWGKKLNVLIIIGACFGVLALVPTEFMVRSLSTIDELLGFSTYLSIPILLAVTIAPTVLLLASISSALMAVLTPKTKSRFLYVTLCIIFLAISFLGYKSVFGL